MNISLQIKPVRKNELQPIQTFLDHELDDNYIRVLGFKPDLHDLERHTFDDPDFESQLFLGAYNNDELCGILLGIRRPWKKGREHVGFIKFIFVRPEFRRQGIGSLLLKEYESRLVDLGCQSLQFGSCSPLYFFPGIPREDSASRNLFKKCNWNESSQRISQYADLESCIANDYEHEEFCEDYQSVECCYSDVQPGNDVFKFIKNEFSHSWAVESVTHDNRDDKSFCSILKDKTTGDYIGFTAVNTANPNWFGPMGVRSDCRSGGYGSLLVKHAFLTAKNRGIDTLVTIQIYIAIIASLLLFLALGHRPTKREMELIHMFSIGWANLDELLKGLGLKKRA